MTVHEPAVPHVLFDQNDHQVYLFSDLVTGEGIQSNQLLIRHGDQTALFDPGGELTYNELSLAISRHVKLPSLTYIFATHQDPDIISSLGRWLEQTSCEIIASRLWSRFLPHLVDSNNGFSGGEVFDRIVAVPDEGLRVPFGGGEIICLPAHFLHSVGNLSYFDTVSGTLFSGDIGASVGVQPGPVEDFTAHQGAMRGFHRRYMGGRRACALWAQMIRSLPVQRIVPQHGGYFEGAEKVTQFLDWLEVLECGLDLVDDSFYQVP